MTTCLVCTMDVLPAIWMVSLRDLPQRSRASQKFATKVFTNNSKDQNNLNTVRLQLTFTGSASAISTATWVRCQQQCMEEYGSRDKNLNTKKTKSAENKNFKRIKFPLLHVFDDHLCRAKICFEKRAKYYSFFLQKKNSVYKDHNLKGSSC